MSRSFRLNPERQVNTWQLISANINRQRSLDISTMRPSPGMCPIWNWLDVCVTEANMGSQRFAQLRDHGSLKRGVQQSASLFGTILVMAVYAPDSSESKSLEMYEACISSVVQVLRDGRRGGTKDFYITSDLNVELGMMRTDEKDIEEPEGMDGFLYRHGYDKDPGGFEEERQPENR